MEILTPELDRIESYDWINTDFSIEPLLKECGILLENHIWITAQRRKISIRKMTSQHIKNCINCLNGDGKLKIPNGYLGGKEKWLKIFAEELESRK